MHQIWKASLLLGLAGASGCIFVIPTDVLPNGQDHTAAQSDDLLSDLSDLTLVVPAGQIEVLTGSTPGVEATLAWRGDEDDRPFLQVDTVGDAVVHEWICPAQNRRCVVDLVVHVPPTLTALTVDLDAGDVITTGLSGLLDVTLDAGDVDVVGHDGTVQVGIDAGSLDARDLCVDTVDVSIDAGNVDLELCDRPDEVRVGVDTGNVTVGLPAGSYDLQTQVSVGSTDIDASVVHESPSDSVIAVQVDVGRIEINGF